MEKDRDAGVRVEVERVLLGHLVAEESRRGAVEIGRGTVVFETSTIGEAIQRHGLTAVLVDSGMMQSAMHRTGMRDATALVEFALSLLMEHDPSAEIARAARGSLPGLDLPI